MSWVRRGAGSSGTRSRPRRPWQSLTGRLALAFMLISGVTLGLVGVFSYLSTRGEFTRLLRAQVQAGLTAELQRYFASHGSLTGFVTEPDGGPGTSPPRPVPDRSPGPPRQAGGPYYVLDAQGRTLVAVPGHPLGSAWPTTSRAAGIPVTVAGQPRPVAYLLPTGNQPPQDTRTLAYLNSTARAILLVMGVAALIAVLMGLWMARTLLQPLQGLLCGIQAMQRGEEVEALPTRQDELGELLAAFQAMSREVAGSQQARRQLTADIAHDLNTPLTVIGGTLEGLLDGTFQPTPERLERLHRETLHVQTLVRNLRLLALADAGELDLQREALGLWALLARQTEGFQEVARRQDVVLSCNLPPGRAEVRADPTRLTQVLQNLLGNALAHTGAGDRIVVSGRLEGGVVSVAVQDSGAGIPADVLPRVFERLYRADRARSGGGSGLGLSICRSVVEAHGGQIGVSSAAGKGTTVTFTLPTQPPQA